MAKPISTLATLRPDLATFMAFDLEANRRGFIWPQVAPVIEVASASGSFGKIPLAELLQNRDTLRAPGAGYSRSTFKFDKASYATEEHGAEEPVDDNEALMYANYFDLEQIAAARALDAVLTNAEKRWAAAIFNTTTWTGSALSTTVGTKWDVPATATPITDVKAAKKKIFDGSGLWPNALIISRLVFEDLRECTQVINRIESSGAGRSSLAGEITAQMLAMAFDLDKVIVAGAAKNSATEGQAAAPAMIWDTTKAMLCKIATTNDMREPCIARTFHWDEDGSQIGGAFETYRDETVRSDIVRCRHQVDEIVLYKEAGHLLNGVK